MKRYESIFIVKVNLPANELSALIENVEKIVSTGKGRLIATTRWGQRKLAYHIKKQSVGYYVLIDYAGDSSTVAELERNLRIDDRILKYLTVKKKDKITEEEIEEELALKQGTVAQEPVAVESPAAESFDGQGGNGPAPEVAGEEKQLE